MSKADNATYIASSMSAKQPAEIAEKNKMHAAVPATGILRGTTSIISQRMAGLNELRT